MVFIRSRGYGILSTIEYQLDIGELLSYPPEVMGTMTQENHNDVNRRLTCGVIYKFKNTSSFEHTHGFTILVGISGKIGLPLVAEGQIKAELSTDNEWIYRKTESTQLDFDAPKNDHWHRHRYLRCS